MFMKIAGLSGACLSTISSVKAPLPQATSTHRKPARGAIQSRKILPASLLPGSHHPLIGSPVVEADLMLGHWSF
jgi:hypothetical protein